MSLSRLGFDLPALEATRLAPAPPSHVVDPVSPPPFVDGSPVPNKNVKAIQDFFARGVLPAQMGAAHTSSDGTRAPAFWDKHLDGLQILRRVEHYGNMTRQLADLTKQYLEDSYSYQTDISLLEGLQAKPPAPEMVNDEAELVEYYSRAIGTKCSQIASFLLSGSCWTRPIVEQKSSQIQSQASADVNISLDAEAIKECSHLGPIIKGDLLLAAKSFPKIGVVEVKNLRLDTPKQLQALLDVAGQGTFDWTQCNNDECKQSHFKDGYSQITCAPMGLDAASWSRFQYPDYQTQVSHKKRGPEAVVPDPPCQDKPSHLELTKEQRHAHDIFQQVYAEGVAHDATFLLIRCGNHEIICLRNREHQTLHISEVISSNGPAYLQIHVGLYIASVLDAIQRSRLLNGPGGLPRTWKKNWNRSMVKNKLPPPETLLSLAHQLPEVVLHSPILNTPAGVKSPRFFRVGTEPSNVGGPVMQIMNPTTSVSERTYRAILHVMGHKVRGDVYLKLARTPENQTKLLHEFKVYQTLARKNISGIPDIIGCFYYMERANDIRILAMISLGAGIPISQDDRAVPDTFIPLLQRIHDGGYLHGLIRPEHLLVDGPETTLISLGKATVHNVKDAMTEMDTLRSLLLLRDNKRQCRRMFENVEQVVVIEHPYICRDPEMLFVSLMLHVPTLDRTLDENTIERVLYDECASKSRFLIEFKQLQDASKFVSLFKINLPDKLRDVVCAVQDAGIFVANSHETYCEFSPERLLAFTAAAYASK